MDENWESNQSGVVHHLGKNRVQHDYANMPFNSSFVGMFQCRLSDGMITWMNKKALSVLTTNRDKDVKITLWNIVENAGIPRDAMLEMLKEKDEVGNIEIEIKQGNKINWFSISCKYYSEVDIIDGILVDITEKKLQEQKIMTLREELDMFIYHASHELKSPLTTILGIAYLLKRDKFDADAVNEYSDMIEDRARYLEGLFKELTHIHFNNQTGLVPDEVDFSSILNSILKELSPRHPNVQVNYDLLIKHPFFSDTPRIKIVLKNLISNAFKFQRSTSPGQYISIIIVTNQNGATISVQDNGIGIDRKVQDNLFKIFFKGSDISKRGYGVGLYLTRTIVEKMGGSVSVDSSKGRGSTFFVRLPDQGLTP